MKMTKDWKIFIMKFLKSDNINRILITLTDFSIGTLTGVIWDLSKVITLTEC
jgi:hypothetical protein